jgi:hypothetical protein
MLSTLHAAELQPETLSSWDRYIQAADGAMHARLLPGHKFLWIDEAPDRRQQLRQGEILASNYEGSAEKVPSGLIHHWIGAAFFPNTKMDDVLGVVRDYSRYKDYYNPSVIDSHTIQQTADTDRFSMLLMNKAFFLKTALAGEYRSVYAQAGNKRWYGIASSVRMQEVEDYGGAGEHKLPSDHGSGYIWRMHSITRFEEADGGVYVEMETVALSRDIPAALRWMVNPIVRRVARGAMLTSLRQTMDAVSSAGQMAAAKRPVVVPSAASGFVQSSFQH